MVAMLASMFVVGTPASAAYYNYWTAEDTPTSFNNVIGPGGNDIVDMAVAADGKTIYAVCGTTDTDSATTGIQLGMFKSLDGGATWARLTTLPTTIGTTITKVAVAPDSADGSVVAIIADTNEVYLSTNGGSVWTALADLNPVAELIGNLTSAASLNCIDISRTVGITRTLAVGGTNASGLAGVWYLEIGALVSRWVDATDNGTTSSLTGWTISGFATSSSQAVWALKFSPTNFPGDRTMAVVTGPTSSGASANLTIDLQVANFVTKVWNAGIIGYTGWGTGVNIDTLTAASKAVQSASLALAPTYLGQDAASRLVYVGLATDDATRVGGVYRFTDRTKYELLATTKIHSVAVNAGSDKLVAGAYASNYVYRLASPATAVSTSLLASSLYKSPSGVEKVVVAWMGTSVIAGTTGLNSAFSVSKDDGKSFNGISLVDNNGATSVLNPTPVLKDFTLATDGTKVYLVTLDASGAYVSLWKKVTAWERVLVTNLALDFIVRAAPENFDVVYITGYAANTMLYSNDGGATTWLPRYFAYTPVDMAVESASVVYVLTGATVSKSIDSGLIWDGGLLPTTIKSGFTGATLNLISAGNLLVGGSIGGLANVAYSTDGNVSWTVPVQVATAAALPTGTAFVTADKLSSGGFIYLATSATSNVYRWNIGVSTSWTKMRTTSIAAAATGIAYSNGVLYVTTGGIPSYLYRTLYPTTTTSDSYWSGFYIYDINLLTTPRANDTPQALLLGPASKLWVIDTLYQKVESYGEYLTYGPTSVAPVAGSEQPIDIATGRAQPITFQFKQLIAAAAYELQIATDVTFAAPVFASGAVYDSSLVAVKNWHIGPNVSLVSSNVSISVSGIWAYPFEFLPDTTYYWRVRAAVGTGTVSTPDSPWSAILSFKMGGIAVAGVTSPAKGANNVPVTPTFVWAEAKGAVLYELEVSTDETFATTDLTATPAKAYYQTADADALAYDTTYYWRVRVATTGTWVYGVFTTMAEPTTPAPLITITQPPETTIQVELPPPVEAVPGYLLWIIIAIGAVLVIALIVLIVRTRRAA
jgi:hypothetical protein